MRWVVLAITLLTIVAGHADAACPLNEFGTCGPNPGEGTTSSLPVDSRECESCITNGCARIFMRYDIPNGELSAFDYVSGDGSGSTTLTMQDDFTLHGPPTGTPVVLLAHMNVNVMKDGLGYPRGYATLSDAFGNIVWATQPGDSEITLEVQCIAGEPFRLRYKLHTISNYYSSGGASGRIAFSNLPAGAVLRSCNGYMSAGAVPIRSTTWSMLKSYYR